MALGLARGVVELADHDPEWEVIALDTIKRLRDILGSTASDIQHVGSSAVRRIKAKPVIDIAVAVWNFDEVLKLSPALEKEGFIFRGWEGNEERQPVFQCGEYMPEEKDMRVLTHYIHIVMADSRQWRNYVNFRDYLNTYAEVASEYEARKLRLAGEYGHDYPQYHRGKASIVTEIMKDANHWDETGRGVVLDDRDPDDVPVRNA